MAILLGTGAAPADARPALTVYAPPVLKEPLVTIGNAFERESGRSVRFHFGRSLDLERNLVSGKAADVLLSANDGVWNRMRQRRMVAGTPGGVAVDKVAMIVPAGNPRGIRTIADLGRPGILVLLTPADVTIGRLTREILERAAATDRVLRNVTQVLPRGRYVCLAILEGRGDTGFAYASDVPASAVKRLEIVEVPPKVAVSAHFRAATLSRSKRQPLARRFVAYLLARASQDVFKSRRFDGAAGNK